MMKHFPSGAYRQWLAILIITILLITIIIIGNGIATLANESPVATAQNIRFVVTIWTVPRP